MASRRNSKLDLYVEQLMFRIRRVIDSCRFRDLQSIEQEKTRDFLRSLRISEINTRNWQPLTLCVLCSPSSN